MSEAETTAVVPEPEPEVEKAPAADATDGTVGQDATVTGSGDAPVPVAENETKNGVSDDPGLVARIVRQVEYYFGDMNLMRDRFLKEKVQEDDGWVTIETMLKFNRLRKISNDPKAIFRALKSQSQLMEVHENGLKMRRSPSKPLPGDTKERRDEIMERSVYAKTFPLKVTLDELINYFETYGPVDNVFMKKDFHKRTFKGSVFATFTKKEDAEKFIKEEGTKYKDTALEMKSYKADYFKEKQNSKKGGKGKGDQKGKPEEVKEETEEDELEKAKQQMTKGAVLHLSGMNPETNREAIRKYFAPHGDVAWVDFDKGVTEGYMRLKEPNSAAATMANATKGGPVVIEGKEVTIRVVEGDEEINYWKKMYKDIKEKIAKKKNKGGGGKGGRQGGKGGRGGGRGGRGGGRFSRGGKRNRGGPQGKRRSNSGGADGEPAAKTAKTEAA